MPGPEPDPTPPGPEPDPTPRRPEPDPTPSRLDRRLGLTDAVVVGLGSMIGAGVFAAVGPAARAAGSGLLLGLAVAGLIAWCNATSSAELAAAYPESGGAYVWGRARLGPFWGYLAGCSFVAGKLASCAAMALTVGAYATPGLARPVALAAVVAVVAANYRGVAKTAAATRVLVALVLAALAAGVVAMLAGSRPTAANLLPLTGDGGPHGLLQAAGLLFFAFAGYARIATLGEEVVDPARTIPRAIPLALGIALAVYATVCTAALLAVGPDALAASPAPLASAVEAGRLAWLAPVVRAGAALAALGVLLSLVAGVSRTAFAMAAAGDLPGRLAAVHPRFRVPHRAELAVGALVGGTVAVADVRGAIGFSSVLVLVYYAVANAAALALSPAERRWPRWLAVTGLAGCLVVAASLPAGSLLGGTAVLAAATAAWVVRRVRGRRQQAG
jgi:APA family basic amino acid/polyamine antiporter